MPLNKDLNIVINEVYLVMDMAIFRLVLGFVKNTINKRDRYVPLFFNSHKFLISSLGKKKNSAFFPLRSELLSDGSGK